MKKTKKWEKQLKYVAEIKTMEEEKLKNIKENQKIIEELQNKKN